MPAVHTRNVRQDKARRPVHVPRARARASVLGLRVRLAAAGYRSTVAVRILGHVFMLWLLDSNAIRTKGKWTVFSGELLPALCHLSFLCFAINRGQRVRRSARMLLRHKLHADYRASRKEKTRELQPHNRRVLLQCGVQPHDLEAASSVHTPVLRAACHGCVLPQARGTRV